MSIFQEADLFKKSINELEKPENIISELMDMRVENIINKDRFQGFIVDLKAS